MIVEGDCLDEMRKMESNSISAIVTDPPYGLSFMGKGWDHAVPGKEYWEECKRLLKPGGFLLAMGGSRTFHRLTCAIEDAGLEIRDCLMWLYGSGFPKSHNHFGIEGYGTALKPAWEPIIMAMKPCEGTFKQNAEKWGQAGINIDDCRIGIGGDKSIAGAKKYIPFNKGFKFSPTDQTKGRWPVNLILDEEAAKMLDQQSGISKCQYSNTNQPILTSKGHAGGAYGNPSHLKPNGHEKSIDHIREGFNDSRGVSRFFYCAKACASERGENNKHPTVKPLKLMEYLIKLVMPPVGGILLDPFAGSGTTILAAKRLGFEAIGIEKDEGYCEIAKSRVANFQRKDIIKEKQQFELKFAQTG